MINLQIDKEFKDLIPPLKEDEIKQLEENILSSSIRDKIVIWNNIIIDGHNRYAIAKKHNLKFETKEEFFSDRKVAKIWIIKNQFGRRNLSNFDRCKLALEVKPLIAEKAKENQKLSKGQGVKGCQKSDKVKIDTKQELATIAGVSHDTLYKVDKIIKDATPEIINLLSENKISINEAFIEIKKAEKEKELSKKKKQYSEKIKIMKNIKTEFKIDIYNTDKKFRIIYADPPWSYNDKCESGSVQSGGVQLRHYDTMTIKELCELPIKNLSDNNAVLFIWITSPLLTDGIKVLESWGFKYKASFIWDKIKHNMGHYNSVRHEFLLIATKGSCTPDNLKLFDSVQSIERSEHSKKPVEFMNIIDDLYSHGDRIELFSRDNKKNNWFYWGNEV